MAAALPLTDLCGYIVVTKVKSIAPSVLMVPQDVDDSLNSLSHKSKPQLLKRDWSDDMTRNVQRLRKGVRDVLHTEPGRRLGKSDKSARAVAESTLATARDEEACSDDVGSDLPS